MPLPLLLAPALAPALLLLPKIRDPFLAFARDNLNDGTVRKKQEDIYWEIAHTALEYHPLCDFIPCRNRPEGKRPDDGEFEEFEYLGKWAGRDLDVVVSKAPNAARIVILLLWLIVQRKSPDSDIHNLVKGVLNEGYKRIPQQRMTFFQQELDASGKPDIRLAVGDERVPNGILTTVIGPLSGLFRKNLPPKVQDHLKDLQSQGMLPGQSHVMSTPDCQDCPEGMVEKYQIDAHSARLLQFIQQDSSQKNKLVVPEDYDTLFIICWCLWVLKLGHEVFTTGDSNKVDVNDVKEGTWNAFTGLPKSTGKALAPIRELERINNDRGPDVIPNSLTSCLGASRELLC